MVKSKALPVIAILGLLLIGVSVGYRQHVMALRRRMTAIAAPSLPTPPATRGLDQATLAAQEAALRAAIKANPQDRKARWALVLFYGQTGQSGKASTQLDAIENLGAPSASECLALANSRLLLQQYPQAAALYRKEARLQPGDDRAWQGLATALYRQGRYYEAMQAAQTAVNLAPAKPENHLALASCALAYGLQFSNFATHHEAIARAQSEFQTLTKTMPNSAEIFYHLGQCEVTLNDSSQAISSLRRSLQISPSVEAFQALVVEEMNVSDYAAARTVAEQGIARYPNDALLHDLRGRLLQSSAEPSAAGQALAEFRKAVSLQPDNELFQEHEGGALLRAGQLPAAQQAFETAVRLNPNLASPYQQLAVIYTRLNDTARAKVAERNATAMAANQQQLQQIQALTYVHPTSIPLRLILADRYRQLGMTAAARDEYLLVQRLDPANTRAHAALSALASTKVELAHPDFP